MDSVDSKKDGCRQQDSGEKSNATKSATDAHNWIDNFGEILVGKPTASMPVCRDSYKYNMNHRKRGKAVIFNHKEFTNGQPTRRGTEEDESMLRRCLNSLGFEVIVYQDIKKIEVLNTLKALSNEDHSESDCILIVVLSHGEDGKIHANDSCYGVDKLWDPFTANVCPSLAGKPKIFFIQACRGDKLDSGTKLLRTQTDSVGGESGQDRSSYVIPNRADFLIVYSTAPGYMSWRNPTKGSWFIQSLTNVLNTHKDEKDLLSMMTIVTREVALNFQSCHTETALDEKKQVPMISSTLTREVYLCEKF